MDPELLVAIGARFEGGRVWLPWIDAGGITIYSTGRAVNGASPKYRHQRGARPPLYATPGAWDARRVVLVEGHIDALAAAQAGTCAFATTTASLADDAVKWLASREEVVLVADRDEAGARWLGDVIAKIGAFTKLFEVSLPAECKDLGDVAQLANARGEDPGEVVAELLERATPVDPCPEPEGSDRARSFDITRLSDDEVDDDSDYVVRNLMRRSAVIVVAGEEGDGKTTFAEQLCRQLLRGERIFGVAELIAGDAAPARILFVDTEMERPEVNARCRDMDARGLAVPEASLFWLTAGALALDASVEDRRYLLAEIDRVGAEMLWIDSGTNALGNNKDDESVRPFFNWLSELKRTTSVRGVGITLHPRKRAQGGDGRRFDDLFGSREWKGRPSKIVWLEGNRLTVWKDRGSTLRKLWRPSPGQRYPRAFLDRPGLDDAHAVPFVIREATSETPATVAAFDEEVFSFIAGHPGEFTRNQLADQIKGRKADVLAAVHRLLDEGRIGPPEDRKRLHPVGERRLEDAG